MRMSHFTSVKTELKDEAALRKALADLGYSVEEKAARGWKGARADVKFRVASGRPGYDIGFLEKNNGFELVADWSILGEEASKAFRASLVQRYAYHVAVAQMAAKGLALIREEHMPDGRIRLLARRMA